MGLTLTLVGKDGNSTPDVATVDLLLGVVRDYAHDYRAVTRVGRDGTSTHVTEVSYSVPTREHQVNGQYQTERFRIVTQFTCDECGSALVNGRCSRHGRCRSRG